jgi:sec-independent protein translocase protein TatA
MQGYEIFLVVGVIVLLFGGSQLPKLARSLGEAKKEFEGGQTDPADTEAKATKTKSKSTETKSTETTADDDQA